MLSLVLLRNLNELSYTQLNFHVPCKILREKAMDRSTRTEKSSYRNSNGTAHRVFVIKDAADEKIDALGSLLLHFLNGIYSVPLRKVNS